MEKQIKCPKCNEIFEVDETKYNNIVTQIRNKEFDNELKNRMDEIEKRKQLEIENEINNYKSEWKDKENKYKEEIKDLENKINNFDISKKIEINECVRQQENKIHDLEMQVRDLKHQNENDKKEYEAKIRRKDNENMILLQNKQNELDNYKNYRLNTTVKLLGENLEKYCENEFNKLRSTAFQDSYFEKDNTIQDGTKGDYIFKEFVDGVELISIMFEMKNESEDSVNKQKNEDFFKKLDKDRRDKNCEYAVLVSMLERDSEFYNTGIVDVSHKYEKMFVIRPNFFIPLISLLRNAARKAINYKIELANEKSRQVDITNFEEKLNEFKNSFYKNCNLANEHFEKSIKQIDDAIKSLEKTKEGLTKTMKQLEFADNKLQNITVKKLTHNNQTMTQKFNEINKKK